ncbi:MAG: glycosyltransferase family 2 protein [Weeksellaceae bacterium]|nr:glycosyltransferase family 2 protein [Bacteroidota bacterium]MCG2779518.1 glycosyltransferase family 2 protein [Weeksellaceae bacterium]
MPNIYFIIVTYNAMKWAERCFSSLRKSSAPVNIIAVDNGSTDGTQDFIKTNFPEVELIQSEENLGFGKANNIGIETAYKKNADFFYLMNQDAWIFENSVAELLNVYNSYPNKSEIGILSPIHLDGSEKKLDIFIDKYIAMNFENRMISDFYLNSPKPYYEISFVNAAHWLIPKETIEKAGGFNPYFFHYGEDNEYVNRVHYHQKKIVLVSASKAVHDGKQDLAKVDSQQFEDLSLETRILDPNEKNEFENIRKSLLQSVFKNLIMTDFNSAKKTYKIYLRITSQEKLLKENKKFLTSNPHPFLNL